MKIKNIKIRHLYGTINTDGNFWEERLVRPIDIYSEFRSNQDWHVINFSNQVEKNKLSHDAYFVQIETENDFYGIGGPFEESIAYIIKNELSQYIINQDPLALEYLWDLMHRGSVHGRQGNTMIAISAIDNALWDLKGKYFNVPVYSLIGGPTINKVPAYASMLGFNVDDMGLVAERAKLYHSYGYKAQKWFFRHGPMSGPEGLRKNVQLVKTLREELGEDVDIMLDCWQSMDVNYVVKLTKQIEEYSPRWIEEVVMPDKIESYKKIKEATNIPISGGEHHYTRWGLNEFMKIGALDIIQPDIYWAGGLSEVLKIASLATTYDIITIPHGHSSNVGIHFSVSQPPIYTPYQEYLIKWNVIHQHFLKTPVKPLNGFINLPKEIGLGMELDEDKIEKENDF